LDVKLTTRVGRERRGALPTNICVVILAKRGTCCSILSEAKNLLFLRF